MEKLDITMISDYECPFCYGGKAVMDSLKSEYDLNITFQAYRLHPEVPLDGVPIKEYFKGRDNIHEYFHDLAQRYNVDIHDSEMQTVPNTERALEVGEYAKTIGKSDEYANAMYKALWVDGINISLVPEIKKISASVGITQEEVDDVLARGEFTKVIDETMAFCEANNIHSVPTWIVNNEYMISGAQSADYFRQAFEQIITSDKD